MQAAAEIPLPNPFFSNQLLIGKKSIARIPAIVKGTKKGFAKYIPAKNANAIINK